MSISLDLAYMTGAMKYEIGHYEKNLERANMPN
jgi:hypothetical protein